MAKKTVIWQRKYSEWQKEQKCVSEWQEEGARRSDVLYCNRIYISLETKKRESIKIYIYRTNCKLNPWNVFFLIICVSTSSGFAWITCPEIVPGCQSLLQFKQFKIHWQVSRPKDNTFLLNRSCIVRSIHFSINRANGNNTEGERAGGIFNVVAFLRFGGNV